MEMECDARELSEADVYRAFAVIQHVMPGFDLEAWKTLTATPALRYNWLTVTDPQGYIRGLCHVFLSQHPALGRQLEVPIFASVSLIDEQGVVKRLFELAERRARQEACDSMHFWPAGSLDWNNVLNLRQSGSWSQGLVYRLPAERGPVIH
ncbi:hypothetical protein [Rhizobium terrae]|uniref:hypothetical protein n=1 Tax=Rhizobium terrae TaxID=2171756 RepID=UPI000E3D9D94|nr:hypothetical protein [Rhizobium terrae]